MDDKDSNLLRIRFNNIIPLTAVRIAIELFPVLNFDHNTNQCNNQFVKILNFTKSL